ncbi:IS66 family transposase [Wolbachia endosymbiont of Delia radicum]|uniref:IS66 family transposase n=1 Tax=Wolbachia endosymbiont of Delia radicum TaxID=502352 RepID=UPI001F1A114A|nr:IS66 family transposase [Wolbachia endosymbiont of Delia radicum]UJQ21340.1 IS66 family transposase [Wolbachia endosymbiont of Delia radicum]
MVKLLELCENLKIEVENLKAENETLRVENAQLKERLGLNSKNSSIPSSKELYKIKKNKQKSERNIGGQVGHEGNFRARMEVDKVVKVELPYTCECGGELAVCEKPYIHQKVDIPEIKPYVVEYQLEHGRCRKCGKRRSSSLPKGVTPDTFGPRAKSVIAALSGFYKNSKREVASIINEIFNLSISVGSISNSEHRVASKCRELYEQIEQEISRSKVLHIDETSHYNKGKLGWCWIFASNQASFVKLTESRGMKVLKNNVCCNHNSLVVTDRYAVYNYFSDKKRQICWAHLTRDFERLAHSWNIEVKILGCYLRHVATELFGLKKALQKNEIDVFRFTKRAKKLRKRTRYYLKKIFHLPETIGASRVAKNILKSETMIWKFLDDPRNIPLTNNFAERQIRHYVVYRKNSYFTQSKRGNTFLERIISLYLTWKQKGLNPFHNLLSIVS